MSTWRPPQDILRDFDGIIITQTFTFPIKIFLFIGNFVSKTSLMMMEQIYCLLFVIHFDDHFFLCRRQVGNTPPVRLVFKENPIGYSALSQLIKCFFEPFINSL